MNFLTEHFGEILTGFVTGLAGFFSGRTKTRLDNENKIIRQYKEALDDLENRWKKKFDTIEKELEEMRREQEFWKQKYLALKKDFERYKKTHATN